MSIYAIADLHLSYGTNKPMNIFGNVWEDYEEKLKQNWILKNPTLLENPIRQVKGRLGLWNYNLP